MSYMEKARAAQKFLTARRIAPEDVLSLDVAGPVRIQLYGRPLSGVSWESHLSESGSVHHRASVVQDGVELLLVVVTAGAVAA